MIKSLVKQIAAEYIAHYALRGMVYMTDEGIEKFQNRKKQTVGFKPAENPFGGKNKGVDLPI